MPKESLQIMVHGDGIAALDVAIDHPGVTLQKVVSGDSPNYRFVYLTVGQDAQPGTLELKWTDPETAGGTVGTTSFELLGRKTQELQG